MISSKGVIIDNELILIDKNTFSKVYAVIIPVAHSDQSFMENETSHLIKKLIEAKEQNRKLKNIRWEIAFEENL